VRDYTAEIVRSVLQLQAREAKEGRLTMWTVYDHPDDYPDGFCARMHTVGKGVTATPYMMGAGPRPDELREVFRAAGLHCIARQDNDDSVIVETWL
jgi:hypothetical protein